MALVVLPCDFPYWTTVQAYLKDINECNDVPSFITLMIKLCNLCNVSLDTDEDDTDQSDLFTPLADFLSHHLSREELDHFFHKTLKILVRNALALKHVKPVNGLQFSLQQQLDCTEFQRSFVSSLIAHSFFSTFPKRTSKTHPTLQDFNFSSLFKHLDQNYQKAKLRSILHYFDLQDDLSPSLEQTPLIVTRQVMPGREWLTIEDWLECSAPLCVLKIRHEGRLDVGVPDSLTVCFSSARVGGLTLNDGSSRESIQFATCPELLCALLFVEALEDNEVLLVENVQQVSKIITPRYKATYEPFQAPQMLNICCMDAENYSRLPLSQYEEDNVLRELNKALLGFRQKSTQSYKPVTHQPRTRRLSPIGESFSSTPPENENQENKDPKNRTSSSTPVVAVAATKQSASSKIPPSISKRGRFIVLGSSGECLPISRREPLLVKPSPSIPAKEEKDTSRRKPTVLPPQLSSMDEEEEMFFTARNSVHDPYEKLDSESEELAEENARRYSGQLDTLERRNTFAERLKEALYNTRRTTESSESSYAVGISVAGSGLDENDIRMRRGGSRGFMLEERSSVNNNLNSQYNNNNNMLVPPSPQQLVNGKPQRGNSSKYSFSTDYTSDSLDEVYETLNKWLDESTNAANVQTERHLAVMHFASSLLKRTLSESFVGMPMSDDDERHYSKYSEDIDASPDANDTTSPNDNGVLTTKQKLQLAARSLSLEISKHKNGGKILTSQLLSNQLISNLLTRNSSTDLLPVVTGNWGCGTSLLGDVQLKLLIQWLASSVANVPQITYYTFSHFKLRKLDTICRVLLDRKWSVGDLVQCILNYVNTSLRHPNSNEDLFEFLINSSNN
uniref:poly(ADP-ribose) glycohydrolase n=1 Tax=Cacopsylla melanoneura TaxID=428564 RepID=A0A8D8LVQ9_9HEMI